MMGMVVAVGVGAAAFLVMHGYEEVPTNAVQESTESVKESKENQTDVSKLAKDAPSNEEMFANIEARIEEFPHDRVRVYKYGAALVGLGEFDRAEKFYRKQLDMFPTDVQIAYGLGWCHEKNKRWAEAVEAYTWATRIDRKHRRSKNNLAWVLATAPDKKVRNGSRAVSLARQAIGNQQPPDPMYMDTLAAAYAEAGSFRNAVKIQRYVSRKTEGASEGVEKRLKLYLNRKPYRMAE